MDDRRRQLLQFLDEHAFHPVLTASLDRADRREALEDAQAHTELVSRRYHQRCATAEEVRRQFLADCREPAAHVDRELDRLGLPTLCSVARAFAALCDALGVGDEEGAGLSG